MEIHTKENVLEVFQNLKKATLVFPTSQNVSQTIPPFIVNITILPLPTKKSF